MPIFLLLHAIAARRGDGLHPALQRAMSRANDLRRGPLAQSRQAVRRTAGQQVADVIVSPQLGDRRGEDARRAPEAGADE